MKKLIDCLKVGDKVFDVHRGWGIVQCIYTDSEYPILVHFEKHSSNADYTADGRLHDLDINPSLFLNEITLKQELPEFIEGEIVLACQNEESSWIMVKYKSKDIDGYLVKISCFEGFIDTTVLVKYVKSFDKSHFESK